MEVTIEKQYPVAAGMPAAWAVLSDTHALATACLVRKSQKI